MSNGVVNIMDRWIIRLHMRGVPLYLAHPRGEYTRDIYAAHDWHYKKDVIEQAKIESQKETADLHKSGGRYIQFARRRNFFPSSLEHDLLHTHWDKLRKIVRVLPKCQSKCQYCGEELNGKIHCPGCSIPHLYT